MTSQRRVSLERGSGQAKMDLLEELELEQHEAASASAVGRGDFVQQHIRHLQIQLQKMWTAKKRTESVVVPYMWLFAQVFRSGLDAHDDR